MVNLIYLEFSKALVIEDHHSLFYSSFGTDLRNSLMKSADVFLSWARQDSD